MKSRAAGRSTQRTARSPAICRGWAIECGTITTASFPCTAHRFDRSNWTATAFAEPTAQTYFNQPNAAFSPYLIADDYWTSNKAQEPGQWFAVDMGTKQTFARLTIDTRHRFADYPRGYELYVSNDGVNWGAPIAKGRNDQSVLRLTFPAQSARYIKVVQTGKTWHHWVVASFEVFAPIGAKAPPTAAPAKETALEPRAWTATSGPKRWYDADVALRPSLDPNRYTTTGQPQRPGLYYQVDMGEPQRFQKIVLNCGRNASDYPRGYDVQVSSDGLSGASRSPPAAALPSPRSPSRPRPPATSASR